MINREGFIRAFVNTQGNMSVKDFLDNGYTMEHFIQYSQNNASFEQKKAVLKIGIEKCNNPKYNKLLKLFDSN